MIQQTGHRQASADAGRSGAVASAALMLTAILIAPSMVRAESPKTYFDYVQSSWAVGSIALSREFKFRDGRLRAYPGRFTDLIHAKLGKPRSLMFVYELAHDETEPPYDPTQPIFAPIELLARNKYWRDNLPITPHHSAPAGSRYIFTGEDIGPASAAARRYAKTLELKGQDRWRAQNAVLIDAMLSGVDVLREDGVRHLSRQLPLTRALDDDASSKLGQFITGDFPEPERLRVVRAIGRAGSKSMAGPLETLAARDDDTAAAALAALAAIGRPRSREQLDALRQAATPSVRAWAIESVGATAGTDEAGLALATSVLVGDDEAVVRAGAATGLGRSGAGAAVPALVQALERDDEVSRDAGLALAAIRTPEAIAALKKRAAGGGTNTMIAAVLGLGAAAQGDGACADCRAYLKELRNTHDDETVRDVIGIVLDSGGGLGN